MIVSRDLQVGSQTLHVSVDISTEIKCHETIQDMLESFMITQSEKSTEHMSMELQAAAECVHQRWELFKQRIKLVITTTVYLSRIDI